MSSELVAENFRWGLSDLISVEKHLQLDKEANSVTPDTWCVKKHSLHFLDHSLGEAIEHADAVNKKLSNNLAKFKSKAEKILLHHPTLEKVRNLRNEYRELIDDPTLSECGSVCDLDKLKAKKNLYKSGNPNKSTYINSVLSTSGVKKSRPIEDLSISKKETNMAKLFDKPTVYKVVSIGAGNAIGHAYNKYGSSQIDAYITPMATDAFAKASTWVDTLGIGVGGTILGMKMAKKNEKLGLAIVAATTNVLTKKLIDLASSAKVGTGLRMNGLPLPMPSATSYGQPRLIQVD